jgi:hypothetical protein
MRMTYDHWKSTNPADEWLGPEPGEEEEEREMTEPDWHSANIERIVVVWDDYERSVGGISWTVGNDGITCIEAIVKNGEYCSIPYVRVWRGEHPVAEYCQHALREVRFRSVS